MAEESTRAGQGAGKSAPSQSDTTALLAKQFAGMMEAVFGGAQGLLLKGIVISSEDGVYPPREKGDSETHFRKAVVSDGEKTFTFTQTEDSPNDLVVVPQMSPITVRVNYTKTDKGAIAVFGELVS